jgi:Asp-tRNA(Asn)/Glu-tRNA(Gln) amidotransferase A subunit family amidase
VSPGRPARSWGEWPIFGVHFPGRFGDEATLIRLAARLEAAQPRTGRHPAVHAARPREP